VLEGMSDRAAAPDIGEHSKADRYKALYQKAVHEKMEETKKVQHLCAEVKALKMALSDNEEAKQTSIEMIELEEALEPSKHEIDDLHAKIKESHTLLSQMKAEKEQEAQKMEALNGEMQELKEALECSFEREKTCNVKMKELKDALKQKEREVTVLKRELELQEDFCRSLRLQLAEQEAPVAL
jgi:chromosome segregation ATPase